MALDMNLNSDSVHRTSNHLKRRRLDSTVFPCKKPSKCLPCIVSMYITPFGVPLISKSSGCSCDCMNLEPYKVYTMGRSQKDCDFLLSGCRISKIHCQFFFDLWKKKICLSDGVCMGFGGNCGSRARASLNGVFLNGIRIRKGELVEICVGDEILLGCSKGGGCGAGIPMGFRVTNVEYSERIAENGEVVAKANALLILLKGIMSSDDPVKCIQKRVIHDRRDFEGTRVGDGIVRKDISTCEAPEAIFQNVMVSNGRHGVSSSEHMQKETVPPGLGVGKERVGIGFVPPPGKMFCLNQLQCIDQSSSEKVVSLPELLHPVENIVRLFIASFTSDVPWFLSYCGIPPHLPVTIACHSSERCWSSSPDKRTSIPYPDFPNLMVVYPQFPEVISFGKGRKKFGIACHHPKLFLVQREDSLRVVITSANLVPGQWHRVTNTVWWQDFPRLTSPDCLSFFFQLSEEGDHDSRYDFSSQLAGFIASLLVDVPSQSHWVLDLAKYDFKGAKAHLLTSIPGVYSHWIPLVSEPQYLLVGGQHMPVSHCVKSLGSVEASVAGLSYIFHTSADSNGTRLKKLATILQKCKKNMHGLTEVVLRRDSKIPADANAISILVSNPEQILSSDYVQIGFLPRDVAKWVAPLSDVGLFAFSAYINPEETLASALEGSNKKVQLHLYVFQGPYFSSISEITRTEHVSGVCSLVRALRRYFGLWRLHEVLGQHTWPEHLETDFVFGCSSVGSINAQFLAAFSAAAGKRSSQYYESEESDPDWGCWTASQEIRNPSIKVIFPSAERVKSSKNGILASRRILCFSEKTWQRLKGVGILHDAVPSPSYRDGFPMHVKVARRRFQSKSNASSSFGWVYCGSHNFSSAAWGRPLFAEVNNNLRSNPSLGSKLHICNYEVGVVFVVPPTKDAIETKQLDDIVLPFVVPPPKYKPADRPATPQAMREALAQLSEAEKGVIESVEHRGEALMEEMPNEDEEEAILEASTSAYAEEEKEDEKAYVNCLWRQIDTS